MPSRAVPSILLALVLLVGAVSSGPALAQNAQGFNDDTFQRDGHYLINGGLHQTYDSSSTGATQQPGEPTHAGGTNSVWGNLRAGFDDFEVELRITHATFDTTLAVYTGDAVDALTLVAENDDISSGVTSSCVTFTAPAQSGTYRVAVAGFGGATGDFSLAVKVDTPGSGPACGTRGGAPGGSANTNRVAATVGTGQPVDAALAPAATLGDGSQPAVVLGRSDNFADNLGGAVLARVAGGPLLLTPRDALDARVRDEIGRLLGPPPMSCTALPGGNEAQVYLLGGTAALSEDVEIALIQDGYCTKRVFGPSRYETSVEVASQVEAILRNNGTPTSYPYLIARADNPVDSATGGAYGGEFATPILVTDSGSLHPAVQEYLAGGTSEVTLLGGTAALGQAVEDEIRQTVSGQPGPPTVSRLAGASRDDTARAIAERYAQRRAADARPVDGAVLVNGFLDDTWVFALTAAPLTRSPVLYVQVDDVLSTTTSFLQSVAPIPFVFAFGSTGLISDATLQSAAAAAG